MVAKITKVKYKNTRTGKTETRYRIGSASRKFSPLYYTKAAAIKQRKRFG